MSEIDEQLYGGGELLCDREFDIFLQKVKTRLCEESNLVNRDLERFTWPGEKMQDLLEPGGSYVGADLSNADLRGMDLERVDLSGTNLTGADLRDVNFRGAKLKNADLSHADLRGAILRRTNLKNSRLDHARLDKAMCNFESSCLPLTHKPLLALQGI